MKKTENKKFFKNKIEMVITCSIFILCIFGFIQLGKMDFHKGELNDNQLMRREHPEVPEDNVFEFVNASQVNILLAKKNTIILFGTGNEWTGYYAKILNDVAKNVGITSINYYNIEDDRYRNNATYEHIVTYLENYTIHLDNGKPNIYGPTLVVIKNGIVAYFDDETSLMHGTITPQKYWNEYNTNLKINTLNEVLKDYKD